MASLNINKNTYTYMSILFYFIKMSLEGFHLLDNERLDNSIIKRDFTKKILSTRRPIKSIRLKY